MNVGWETECQETECQMNAKCQLIAKQDWVWCETAVLHGTECLVGLSVDFYHLALKINDVGLVLPWHSVFLAFSCLGIQSISLLPLGQWFYEFCCSYIKDNLICCVTSEKKENNNLFLSFIAMLIHTLCSTKTWIVSF